MAPKLMAPAPAQGASGPTACHLLSGDQAAGTLRCGKNTEPHPRKGLRDHRRPMRQGSWILLIDNFGDLFPVGVINAAGDVRPLIDPAGTIGIPIRVQYVWHVDDHLKVAVIRLAVTLPLSTAPFAHPVACGSFPVQAA